MGFNRTFMELKYNYDDLKRMAKEGFNRTFMELKFLSDVLLRQNKKVLIVPLWN